MNKRLLLHLLFLFCLGIFSMPTLMAQPIAPCEEPNPTIQQDCGTDQGTLGAPVSQVVCDPTETVTIPALTDGFNNATAAGWVVEYVVTNACNIVGTAPTDGPSIVGGDADGIFAPGDLGFVDGDQFCVTAINYDLAAVQAEVDALLNGVTDLGGANDCCSAVVSTLGTDACQALNDAGINSGADITGFGQVADVVAALGGDASLESITDIINNSINTLSGQTGIGECDDGLPICYATSTNNVCYIIDSTDPSCASCPTFTSVDTPPATAACDGTATIASTTSDNASADLTFAWSITGGAANATLTGATTATATVTFDNPTCADVPVEISLTITCTLDNTTLFDGVVGTTTVESCVVTQACDDGDPCTENDMEDVGGNGTGDVCVACAGTPAAACSGAVANIVQACDDGDPCTENDMEELDGCDATTVCVPCAGTAVAACSLPPTMQACDDGDPCTENDMEGIDQCDGSVCVPCAGTAVAACSLPPTMQACDDGDPCTENDMEGIDQCDGSVCVPCAGTAVAACTLAPIAQACDDGNPCTENDMEEVDQCDGSVCVPCAGTVIDCTNGATTVQACDDGDPSTINDMETILDCDGSVCVPCAGTAANCDTDPTTVQACDDGDPCTENDMETVLDADGTVCVPCAGDPVAACTLPPTIQTCDDGDPCTENDMESIDQCDGSVCVPCAGTAVAACTLPPTMQACDDGDPNTINDMEGIDPCDGSICVPCAGTTVGCTTMQACDDGDPCTENDMETLDDLGAVCVPCAGTAVAACTLAPTMQACDDGDPCTENDMEGIDQCDGSVCVPCAGTAVAACTQTTVQACDDGDPDTNNDMETVDACTGAICVPCAGTTVNCATMQACDDGDPCTENDMETLDDDGVVCVPCAGTAIAACSSTTTQACDDGDPCTENDMETIDNCNGGAVCVPCAGTAVAACSSTTVQACDDGDPGTINDMETIDNCTGAICVPCAGESTCTSTYNNTTIDAPDVCAGESVTLTASTTDDAATNFEWSVSVNGGAPSVFGSGLGAAIRVYSTGSNMNCEADVYEFFLLATCEADGSEVFNGSVGTVNAHPALVEGGNFMVQSGDCDVPATLTTSCGWTVSGDYQAGNNEAGSVDVTITNPAAPANCASVTVNVPYVCQQEVAGCTDALADNFDPDATTDDGNCIYVGCMDATAVNFDPIATIDDPASCIYSDCILEYDLVDVTQGTSGGVTPFYYNVYEITVTNGTPPYNYAWNTDGYVRHAVLAPGFVKILESDGATWMLTITDDAGCVVIIAEDNGGGTPTLDIPSYVISCESSQFAYNAGINITVAGGVPPYSYQWSTGATTQDVLGLQDGWYSVTVTDSVGDETFGWYWVPQCGGGRGKVSSAAAQSHITTAPNPFHSQTVVEFSAIESGRVSVDVFSLTGAQVGNLFNGYVEANTTYKTLFNADNLAAGIYMLRLTTTTGEVQYHKVMLSK